MFDSSSGLHRASTMRELFNIDELPADQLGYGVESSQKPQAAAKILAGGGSDPQNTVIAINAAIAADLYYNQGSESKELAHLFTELLTHLKKGYPAKLLHRLHTAS